MQVSLFDVSNSAATKRTGQVVVPGTPGEGTLDPHTFLYWKPTGLIVVPVQTWTPGQSGKVLVVKAEGAALTKVGLLANPLAAGVPDDGQGIQRSLIVKGGLWTVSGGECRSPTRPRSTGRPGSPSAEPVLPLGDPWALTGNDETFASARHRTRAAGAVAV